MAVAKQLEEAIKRHVGQSEGTFKNQKKHGYQSFQGTRFANTNPFERTAAHMTHQTGAHLPFMQSAQQYGQQGVSPFYQSYQNYMNPYQEAVVNRIGELGNRNFSERLLPQLEAKFVRLGQHGSSGHQKLAREAARDVQSEISGRQAEALSHGYGQAMQGFNADQARLMEMAAQQAHLGSLATGSRLAELADMRQQAALERELEERKYRAQEEDFREAQAYPWKLLAAHASNLYGVPSHLTPYDVRKSLHSKQYQGLGLDLVSKILASRLGPKPPTT